MGKKRSRRQKTRARGLGWEVWGTVGLALAGGIVASLTGGQVVEGQAPSPVPTIAAVTAMVVGGGVLASRPLRAGQIRSGVVTFFAGVVIALIAFAFIFVATQAAQGQ